jgi:hypothetical protein
MFFKAHAPWLAGIAFVLLSGCGGGSFSFLFVSGNFDDSVDILIFQDVTPVVPSAIADRRLVVIRDVTAWDILWREHTGSISPAPTMPQINFSQNMVIGVFLGIRTNACRDVEITSISRHTHPERITVEFREIPILQSALCPSSNSSPAKLVVLPYSFLPVEFFQIG